MRGFPIELQDTFEGRDDYDTLIDKYLLLDDAEFKLMKSTLMAMCDDVQKMVSAYEEAVKYRECVSH